MSAKTAAAAAAAATSTSNLISNDAFSLFCENNNKQYITPEARQD